jgi:glycerol-3-phosphate acyltransferase PlsX
MRVVVDAMGGDNAPRVPLIGAVQAVKELDGLSIVLVGNEKLIKRELDRYGYPRGKVEVEPAEEVVSMEEQPSRALKKKKSSIHIGLALLKENSASAFVSAGNTGAVMAISLITLGRLKGVDRPAITTVLPNLKSQTFLLDVGANVDCKPAHLLQFAIMGEAYAKYVLKKQNPKVGLLNIGEEEGKGNELTKKAYRLLKLAKERGLMNFIGNAEGRDIYSGRFDVIVCDGFVGNVALKLSESLARILERILREEIDRHLVSKVGALTLKPAIKSFKKRVDYAEWGGAPLLGVKAPVIISHGSSNAKAIKNAIKVAVEFAETHLNEHIEENIERYGKLDGN